MSQLCNWRVILGTVSEIRLRIISDQNLFSLFHWLYFAYSYIKQNSTIANAKIHFAYLHKFTIFFAGVLLSFQPSVSRFFRNIQCWATSCFRFLICQHQGCQRPLGLWKSKPAQISPSGGSLKKVQTKQRWSHLPLFFTPLSRFSILCHYFRKLFRHFLCIYHNLMRTKFDSKSQLEFAMSSPWNV